MKYVISGKSDSYWLYLKNNKYATGKQATHARTIEKFNKIIEEDTIVLLYGWWARSWAKDAIKEIVKIYPTINFEYLDGPFGESERKNSLQSETISNRFDLLDL